MVTFWWFLFVIISAVAYALAVWFDSRSLERKVKKDLERRVEAWGNKPFHPMCRDTVVSPEDCASDCKDERRKDQE